MKLTHIVAAAAVALLAIGEAQALPIAPIGGGTEGGVILARGGCGFGAHRGPYDGCRLNRGPRGALRGAITGAPRGCPPGRYRVGGLCRFR